VRCGREERTECGRGTARFFGGATLSHLRITVVEKKKKNETIFPCGISRLPSLRSRCRPECPCPLVGESYLRSDSRERVGLAPPTPALFFPDRGKREREEGFSLSRRGIRSRRTANGRRRCVHGCPRGIFTQKKKKKNRTSPF